MFGMLLYTKIEYFVNNYKIDPKKFNPLKLLKNSKDNAFVIIDFT